MKSISDNDYQNIIRFLDIIGRPDIRSSLSGFCINNREKNLIDKAFVTARRLKRKYV